MKYIRLQTPEEKNKTSYYLTLSFIKHFSATILNTGSAPKMGLKVLD